MDVLRFFLNSWYTVDGGKDQYSKCYHYNTSSCTYIFLCYSLPAFFILTHSLLCCIIDVHGLRKLCMQSCDILGRKTHPPFSCAWCILQSSSLPNYIAFFLQVPPLLVWWQDWFCHWPPPPPQQYQAPTYTMPHEPQAPTYTIPNQQQDESRDEEHKFYQNL